MPKPLVLLTMGDPAGIGPEVLLKGVQDEQVRQAVHPVVVGSVDVLEERRKLIPGSPAIRKIEKPDESEDDPGVLSVLDPLPISLDECPPGKVSPATGERAYRYVERATRLVMNGRAAAIITGPLHKGAMNMAGRRFEGHTEIVAQLTHAEEVTLMLVRDNVRIAHATVHMALSEVPAHLTLQRVERVILLAQEALQRMGIDSPRIGVLGLNPHAGEEGLFGREEIDIIGPAIERARKKGADARGPLVPDASFPSLLAGKLDILIAMYHDQGHVPFKALNFQYTTNGSQMSVRGVNVTLGLPIVRTSVDHGTALDIAGQGIADAGSLVDAILLARQLAGNGEK